MPASSDCTYFEIKKDNKILRYIAKVHLINSMDIFQYCLEHSIDIEHAGQIANFKNVQADYVGSPDVKAIW
jgi:ribosomal protein S12